MSDARAPAAAVAPPHEAALGALAGLAMWAGGCLLEMAADPAARSFVTLSDHAMFWALATAPLFLAGLGWLVGERRRELEEAFRLYQVAVDEQLATIAEREWVTRAVVQNAFDAVLILDLHGQVLDANPTAARIFGHPLDELVKLSIDALLPAHERLQRGATAVERRTAGGERLGVEWRTRARHADGSTFPVDLHISILADPGLLVYAIREASTRVRREESLVREALDVQRGQMRIERRRRGTMLLDVSGGLRENLDRVLAQAERLEHDGVDAEQVREIVDASHAILERLDQLWNLTMWERAGSAPTLGPLPVAALLDGLPDALGPAVRKNRNRLVVRPASPIELVTDATLFASAVHNLVSEAARRTHDGEIRVEAVREPGRGTDWLAVFVHDDGPALAPDTLDSAYRAFSATDADQVAIGERAGLVLAQRLARSLGGHVSAESEPGRGTTFGLYLPLDPSKVKDVPSRPERQGLFDSPPPPPSSGG